MYIQPYIADIREYKAELRERYRKVRQEMPAHEKSGCDQKILERILRLNTYKNCRTLLTYVSSEIEVDTRKLLKTALDDGKIVGVPRCVPQSREIEFYIINSISDLSAGAYSIPEPDPLKCEKLIDYNSSVCIIPGLVFDKRGYRLGYGKGYYDRFLSDYKGETVGICYSNCVRGHLFNSRFDQKCNMLLTERYTFKTQP